MFRGNDQSLKSFQWRYIHVYARIFFFFCFIFSTPRYRWFVLYFIKSVFRRWLTVLESYWFQSVVHDIYPSMLFLSGLFRGLTLYLVSFRYDVQLSIESRSKRRDRSIQLFLNHSKLFDLNVKEKSIPESVFFRRRSISISPSIFNLW